METGSEKHAVKVCLSNEMFPKYNFLRRRLFSIYPRFKEVVDKGKLEELIINGKKLMTHIETAKDKLLDSLTIYIIGHHDAISVEQIKANFLVSTKGTDDFNICLRPLEEEDFRQSIRNIAHVPAVIVHVENVEGGASEEAFVGVTSSLVSLLPPKDRNSCVLCTADCETFTTLEEYNIIGTVRTRSEEESLGKLIQTCLEIKVVEVFKQMIDFIKLFFPEDKPAGSQSHEPLWVSVRRSIESSVSEHNLSKEMEELGTKKGLEHSMVWYLCRNIETKICDTLSIKHKVSPNIVHEFMYKVNFDKKIEERIDEKSDFYNKNSAEMSHFVGDVLSTINEDLGDFEVKVDETFKLISGVLMKIEFEINGVFRQAKITNCLVPAIPKDLQQKILSIEGVHGCGFAYGKLVVHVKEDTLVPLKEITDKVNIIAKTTNKNFVNNFEVKQIQDSVTAGITYESGKSIRVMKNPEQITAGDVLANDKHSYGTLGCFVKGKMSGTNPDEYTSQMYALSCAHVFPEGCDDIIEVGRTDIKFDPFGIISQDLTLHKEHIYDIAAIVVEDNIKEKCNINLKNCDGFEGWGSILHEGNFNELIGMEVFKWGSMSDLTHGLIVSIDYKTVGVETLDDEYNILVETLPQLSDTDFSTKGDSGTVVCFEDPDDEKVVALSMINGGLYEQHTKEYMYTYSCHLHTNIEALSQKTNIKFEWYS